MLNINILDFAKELSQSTKFQISAAISFGTALYLVLGEEENILKITLTVLFLIPLTYFISSIIEKSGKFCLELYFRHRSWSSLTKDELEFLKPYITQNKRTIYVPAHHGTYSNSGVINALRSKRIVFLASRESEWRGEHWASATHHFPINISDSARNYYSKIFKDNE